MSGGDQHLPASDGFYYGKSTATFPLEVQGQFVHLCGLQGEEQFLNAFRAWGRRLSLISLHEMADGHRCYTSPQLARIFGAKKLDGDPDKLLVQEDLETLHKFGVIALHEPGRQTQEGLIRQFIGSCTTEATTDGSPTATCARP